MRRLTVHGLAYNGVTIGAMSTLRTTSSVSTHDPGRPEISVCVCTFKRPRGLQRLLRSLQHLDPATPSFEIVVVDNDAQATGEAVVRAFGAEGVPIRYAVEPVRSIARARSRSVHEAAGELVAFIDDDEEADAKWLVALRCELLARRVDGVIGRVVPRFAGRVPRWFDASPFFPRWPTGTVLQWYQTRTSNALVRREGLIRFPGPFDDAYGLTGGEDCELFARMIRAGQTFVAVESGVVYEDVPPARMTRRRILLNHLVNGQIYGRVALGPRPLVSLLPRLAKGLCLSALYAIAGLVVTTVSTLRGFPLIARAASELGLVSGRLGLVVHKYRSADGDIGPAPDGARTGRRR